MHFYTPKVSQLFIFMSDLLWFTVQVLVSRRVRKWCCEFMEGRLGIHDVVWSSQLSSTLIADSITAVQAIVKTTAVLTILIHGVSLE